MKTWIGMFGWMLLVVVTTVTAIEKIVLHDEMTDEEIEQFFRTKRDAVPEYDVVPISFPKLHKRSDGSPTEIRLNAFNRSVDLLLTPSEGILAGEKTRVWFARSDSRTKSGSRISGIFGAMKDVGSILEDRQKRASFMVKKSSDGQLEIFGQVESEGWAVARLPQRLNARLSNRYQRSITDEDDLKNLDALHVISKIPATENNTVHSGPIIRKDNFQIETSRSKRNAPGVIYPQILVIVDHASFMLYNQKLTKLLEYLLPFWNGVDLKYRTLENPKVRFNIAGILIAADATALSFINNNTYSNDSLLYTGALESLAQYMRQVDDHIPLKKYDIAAAMTTYKLCSVPGYPCQTLGVAYRGTACRSGGVDGEENLSVTLLNDVGGYNGIHTAAHELGHLFNASHDGENNCSHESGHIMAPSSAFSENSGFWSRCSREQFKKFFDSDKAQCLYNEPDIPKDLALPRLLPGRILTADEQCKKLLGTTLCDRDQDVCTSLACVAKKPLNAYTCDLVGPAPDGTTCGDKKICYQGRCQAEIDINPEAADNREIFYAIE